MHKPLLIPALLLSLVVAAHAEAKFVPSFNLADVAWNATHVLLVTEGDTIDGKVQVLEVWKGAMERQQWITVPELAAFAPPESREIYSRMTQVGPRGCECSLVERRFARPDRWTRYGRLCDRKSHGAVSATQRGIRTKWRSRKRA